MNDISRYAYLIEGIDNDEIKTVLTVKGLSNDKSFRIAYNNRCPFPFNADTYVAVNILFRIRLEDYKSFISGSSLIHSEINDWYNKPKKEDRHLCLCTTSVFPINIGEVLIIEEPSIYSRINNVLNSSKS